MTKPPWPRARSTAYRAWLVDLDGTLYHQPPLRLVMALELALAGRAAIPCLRAFRREHERLRREPGLPADPFVIQIQRTAACLGRTAQDVRRLIEQWMITRPCRWLHLLRRRTLLRELADFRRDGGRSAVVSDYPARAKLEAMGIEQLFDVVVASGESSEPLRLKPSPDGYLLAAKMLRVPPGACLVIGDRPDADGVAADRAGMAFQRV